jgi:hypothetical protein
MTSLMIYFHWHGAGNNVTVLTFEHALSDKLEHLFTLERVH